MLCGGVNQNQVLEIRPTIKWDKGKALEFLLESLGEFLFYNTLLFWPLEINQNLHRASVGLICVD